MAIKLIISENQLDVIARFIMEGDVYDIKVREVVDDLRMNYEPATGRQKKGGEYHDTPKIMNKVSGELITAAQLLDYFKYKYDCGEEFLKQILRDWYDGNLNTSYKLSNYKPIR